MTKPHYTDHLTFHHIPFHHKQGGDDYIGGWVRDCQGKLDYDPVMLYFCCRTYPSGHYIGSLLMGGTALFETDLLWADTQEEACCRIEEWVRDTTNLLAAKLLAIKEEGLQ